MPKKNTCPVCFDHLCDGTCNDLFDDNSYISEDYLSDDEIDQEGEALKWMRKNRPTPTLLHEAF